MLFNVEAERRVTAVLDALVGVTTLTEDSAMLLRVLVEALQSVLFVQSLH